MPMVMLVAVLLIAQVGDAVKARLDWLEKHQLENGSWRPRESCDCFGKPVSGVEASEDDVKATALAVLAFEAESPRRERVIERGLKWLSPRADAIGLVGDATPNAMAIRAFVEVALASEKTRVRVEWLEERQRDDGAWGPGESNAVATYWALLALSGAKEVDRAVVARGLDWQKKQAESDADFDVAAHAHCSGKGHAARLAKIDPASRDPMLVHAAASALLTTGAAQWNEWRDKMRAAIVARGGAGPLECGHAEGRDTAAWTLVQIGK